MTSTIRLHPIATGPEDPLRLHAFPGRALGEREFDLLQAYAEARLGPLLAPRLSQIPPGIVAGLEVGVTGSGAETRLRLRPGTAVGGDGRPLRLYYPLELSWPQLLTLYRRQAALAADALPGDGLWLLTLRRGVEAADAGAGQEPCTRNDPDPLRDLRLETVSLAGLQLVTGNPRWLAMKQPRAANRVCVRHLDESPFDPVTGAVPLALVKIEDGLPAWFDTRAGRLEARPDGAYRALLAHTQGVMEAYSRSRAAQAAAAGGSAKALSSAGTAVAQPGSANAISTSTAALGGTLGGSFGIGSLAGTTIAITAFPTAAVGLELSIPLGDAAAMPFTPASGLAGRLGIDYLPAAGPLPHDLIRDIGGTAPGLAFDPRDLQVELAPVPARVVPATVARELPRGAVDLIHGHRERIRILVAIDDPDYRPDLLDLPETDLDLVAELDRRGQAAASAYLAWRAQWQALYEGLDADGLTQAQAPSLPDPEPAFLDNLIASKNLLSRVERRAATLPADSPLPAPYADWQTWLSPCETQAPTVPAAEGDGLHARRAQLKSRIADLEDELDLNFDLLNALGDYQTLQRQHLDSITVSFSTLAGGVPGDGSGSTLTRWSNYAVFRPKTQAPG